MVIQVRIMQSSAEHSNFEIIIIEGLSKEPHEPCGCCRYSAIKKAFLCFSV